jgi:hypothetical protein
MSEYVSEILAFIFIAVGVVYFNGKIANVLDEKFFMTRALFTILIVFVLLFVSDKIFFANRDLLSENARASLFSLIEKLLLIMFGYYFGQNQSTK